MKMCTMYTPQHEGAYCCMKSLRYTRLKLKLVNEKAKLVSWFPHISNKSKLCEENMFFSAFISKFRDLIV